jgi:hypothetical protein
LVCLFVHVWLFANDCPYQLSIAPYEALVVRIREYKQPLGAGKSFKMTIPKTTPMSSARSPFFSNDRYSDLMSPLSRAFLRHSEKLSIPRDFIVTEIFRTDALVSFVSPLLHPFAITSSVAYIVYFSTIRCRLALGLRSLEAVNTLEV